MLASLVPTCGLRSLFSPVLIPHRPSALYTKFTRGRCLTYIDTEGEDPLFVTAYGRRIASKVVIRTVRRASQRLGQRIHPHMFRHSYATELLERGADIRDIRDLLGHESVATTEIYTHVSAARKRRVVSLLDRPTLEAGSSFAAQPPEGHVTSVTGSDPHDGQGSRPPESPKLVMFPRGRNSGRRELTG